MSADRSQDIARTTFQLLALGALIASTFWILRPFLVALTWATMIVIATWPLLLSIQRVLGGRRGLAVAVMTTALLLILVVPFYFGIAAIVGNARQVVEWSTSLSTFTLPTLPAWVTGLPLIGAKLAARWDQLAAASPEALYPRLAPYAQKLVLWFVSKVGSVGVLVGQFLLTVIVAAILYANGETPGRGVDLLARRIAGQRGQNAVQLAAQAVRGVALGVVVTAIIQTAFVGLGLIVVGVPFATILSAASFLLSIAQIGPGILLIAVTIWVYSTLGAGWGSGFLVWAIFCSTFDNVLRPMLIKRGADLPLLLIFSGVIGGLVAFGVIGLFVGPTVLAVAYTLLADWVSEQDAPDAQAP